MTAAEMLDRAIQRAMRRLRDRNPIPISKADQAALAQLIAAALKHVKARPAARTVRHHGKLFRLHQVSGDTVN